LAVRLRLRRVGRKKAPIYKVVAADSRSPRDGRYIESIGQYEPLRQSNNVEFKEDRVMYWLQNGAQPTDTVRNLLSSQGLWLKWSLLKKGAEENVITEQMEKFDAQRTAKEQRAEEKAAKKKKKEAAPEEPEKTEEQAAPAETTEPAATPEAAETSEPAETAEVKETKETEEKPKEEAKAQDEPVQESGKEDKPEDTAEEKSEDQDTEKKA
jgi:small subunit ribosomal protein S16